MVRTDSGMGQKPVAVSYFSITDVLVIRVTDATPTEGIINVLVTSVNT